MKNIKYSIVISTFNRPARFCLLLKSLASQTYHEIEIIVVEAGTVEVYERLKKNENKYNGKIKYIHAPGVSLGQARNIGVSNSTGDYVLFSDDDDIWKSNKIEVINKELVKNWAPFLYHQFEVSKDGMSRIGWAKGIDSRLMRLVRIFISNNLSGGSAFGGARVSLLTIQFDRDLRSAEDVEWWIRVLLSGSNILYIEEPLATYIEHNSRMSKNIKKTNQADLIVFRKYFSISLMIFIGVFLKFIRIAIRVISRR